MSARVACRLSLALAVLLCGCGRGTPSPTPALPSLAPTPTGAADARPTPAPVPSPGPTAPLSPSPGPTAVPSAQPLVAFVRGGALWAVPPSGGSARTVAGGPVAVPAWSPAAGLLAYVRPRGEAGGALVLRAIGGRPRALVPGGVTQLAWSPDGTRLAYTRTAERDGDGRLLPEMDRSEVRVLTVRGGADARLAPGFDPSWAPGGRDVLLSTPGGLVGGVPQGNELRLCPVAGGARCRAVARTRDVPTDLRRYGAPFVSPARLLRFGAVSPDGRTVAFVALGGVGVLGTVETRGGEVQVQDILPESGFGPPSWAPGGARIAYHAPTPSGADGVVVLDVAAGNREEYGGEPDAPGYREPAWSPDGGSLAMVRVGRRGIALVLASPGRGEPRVLAGGAASSPTWVGLEGSED